METKCSIAIIPHGLPSRNGAIKGSRHRVLTTSYLMYEELYIVNADSCEPDIKYAGTHQILLHMLKPNMSERMPLLMILAVNSTRFIYTPV